MTSFDLGRDLASCVDGLEAVTVQTASGMTTVAAALRHTPRVTEAEPSEGRYSREDVRWHPPAADLAGVSVGDTITDGQGTTWIVLEAQRASLGSRWVCLTRRLQLSVEESELLVLQHAEWSKDAAGAASATWSIVQSDLVAWIQPLEASREVEAGSVQLAATHVVYLAEPRALSVNERFVNSEGQVFRIVAQNNERRLDALPTVRVRQIDGAEA